MTLPARALVLGLARSGQAASAALSRRGVTVTAVDRRLGNDDDPAALDGVELVVKSPGVPCENVLVRTARERGIPVWSEVELGFRLLPGAKLVGVTGTNGKTTTVGLLETIFRAAGRDVAAAGNVGTPLSSIERAEWVVCELSSFQLEDVHELACEVAVLLNLEPDHLDRHHSFEAYRDAKLRIFERAKTMVVPRDLGLPGIAFGAEDPLPAEPRTIGRTPPRRPRPRAPRVSRTRRSPKGCARFLASPTGSRPWRRSAVSATSTTRRRRTSPPPLAPSRPTTSRCT
jgi:UDP-N-acetylmuramoylalanine--D-glutamate ligase